jgi:hypothetical protein
MHGYYLIENKYVHKSVHCTFKTMLFKPQTRNYNKRFVLVLVQCV